MAAIFLIAAWDGRYFATVLNAAVVPTHGSCPRHTAADIMDVATLPPPMTVILLPGVMVNRLTTECCTLLTPAMYRQLGADKYAQLYTGFLLPHWLTLLAESMC